MEYMLYIYMPSPDGVCVCFFVTEETRLRKIKSESQAKVNVQDKEWVSGCQGPGVMRCLTTKGQHQRIEGEIETVLYPDCIGGYTC